MELMILKDFIKICEENDLTYYMYAGSLLGAIRHNGFIPWDDDLDVVMFRYDFEKFKEVFMESPNPKYELLCNETEKDYFHLLSKLMLKDTLFEESWVNQVDFHIRINIDIFVLDDLSDDNLKRRYQLKKSFLYNKLLIMSMIRLDDLPFLTKLITHGGYYILNLLQIKPKWLNKRCLNFLKKYGFNVISLDDDNTSLDKTVQELNTLIKNNTVKYIYTLENTEVNETVKNLLDGKTVTEIKLKRLDSITDDERRNRETTYFTLMKYNVEQLKKETYK